MEEAPEAAPASVARGVEVIKAHIRHAPPGPGVYRMIAQDGEVLYVGKARSIKKRIASYAREAGHSNRIARMISLTCSMVFVSTGTETEALLLEANYIKQMKPRFNVLLRDDKSFPYILLSGDHAAPQITKHRGARNRKGDYFGPFASVWAVNRTLNSLQRAFLLRSCTDSFYENRTRPCLLFQIKRCAGPCTGEIGHEDYAALVKQARDFLSGKSRAVRERMAGDMNAAAQALEFETAARLRDRIAALSAIQGAQGINPRTVEEADVFALVEEGGHFAIEVFFFRTYQNWGNRTYFPRADRSLVGRRGARRVPRAILRGQARAALRVPLARGRERVRACGGAHRAHGAQGGSVRAQARRTARTRRARGEERARDAGPQARRRLGAGEAARRARIRVRHRDEAAARRDLRQFAHHGDERRRRDGGRRARAAS